jgi:multidrug resistance efflux pump
MSGVELKANDAKALPAIKRRSVLSSIRVVPILVTAAAVALAAVAAWQAWQYYMGAPWTRDGTVRAYVVKIAPQVAGEIVKLPIADNEFVRKGDLLMLIDPRNYSIAVRQAEAAVEQARAVAVNANAEMIRREKLNDIAVTMRSGRPISARRPTPRRPTSRRSRTSTRRASILGARKSAPRSTAMLPI